MNVQRADDSPDLVDNDHLTWWEQTRAFIAKVCDGGISRVPAAARYSLMTASLLFFEAVLAGATTQTGSVPKAAPSSPPALVLTGITVVDVITGSLLANQTAVIIDRHIHSLGLVGTVAVPQGAQVVDGRSKYLIPGLWDMHFHTWEYPQVMYPLAIANGVTGVREMSHSNISTLLEWRQEIAAGKRVGPRAFVTGGYLGATGATYPLQRDARTPEEAAGIVQELKANGADFIKVRDVPSRDVYFAALAEARRLGLPVDGHLPAGVTLAEAADSGQRTFEHVSACPDDAGTEKLCAALAARLRSRSSWLTPTMVARRHLFGGAAPDRLRFWPEEQDVGLGISWFQSSAKKREEVESPWTAQLAGLVRAGIPLLAGTDAAPIMPENTPGFSLHEELKWFVKAGMMPAEALRTATLNPAIALKATDSLGTVAVGKLADLVVLNADPIADIHNVEKIDAVIANGQYFNRAALDFLIATVESRGRGRQEPPTPDP